MRRVLLPLGLTAAGAAAAVILFNPFTSDDEPPAAADPRAAVMAHARAASGDLDAMIDNAREKLRAQPDDAGTWAKLGASYVEQARMTADPTAYDRADGALGKSLQLQPEGNLAALVASGALATARHEFAQARDWAAKALKLSAYNGPAYGVLADAHLNLGDYDKAEQALQRMLDLNPAVPSFLRAAHYFQLTGKLDRAEESLVLALDAAVIPSDVASVWYRKGELAWHRGRLGQALDAYGQAVAAAPAYMPALAGKGRAEAALGRTVQAVADYDKAVARTPHPGLLIELGELHQRLGDSAQAERSFSLVRSVHQLFARSGVQDDLGVGVFEADHGDPALAVRHLRREWERRDSVEVADALGWALHRAGQHKEALAYALKARRLGTRDALVAYHRGEIQRALGEKDAARRSLKAALAVNPHFSRAAEARKALAAL